MLLFGVGIPWALYAAVVLFAPDDVLDRSADVRASVESIGTAVRRLMRVKLFAHADSTAFPQPARLASAMSVWVVVWVALAVLLYQTLYWHELLPRMRASVRSIGQMLMQLFMPVIGFLAWWIFFNFPGDPGFAPGATTHSRAGYLFFSSSAMFLAGVGIGAGVAVWRTFLFNQEP